MIEGLEQFGRGYGQRGLTELRGLVETLLGGPDARGQLLNERQLQPRVRRVQFDLEGEVRSLIVKQLQPSVAHVNQLLLGRWLPAVGLGGSGPTLLGVAAERSGELVWHVYEDLGDYSLAAQAADPERIKAAVEVIALVHTRFANHYLLPECRLHGGDLGIQFYSSNIRDAIRTLELLRSHETSPRFRAVRCRLLERLYELTNQQKHRGKALAELGGPETLLHGDLWTTNTFVLSKGCEWRARLIDWDHSAVGPVSYDLSTFLLRFPAADRLWILDAYREAVADAGWHLPGREELNFLFETAEFARFANRIIWPGIAITHNRAEWGVEALAEVDQWFDDWQPVLPEEKPLETSQAVAL
jgi:hypothetical protein